MSKRQVLCVLGAWIIVFLFLGFPALWDKVFAIICGLAVIIIAYSLHTEGVNNSEDEQSHTFVDNVRDIRN